LSYVELKSKTPYSILEGSVKIKESVSFCKADRMVALGFADTNNMCAALEFSKECISKSIQPIIGINIDISLDKKNIDGKLTLFAQSQTGYENLMALSSLSYTRKESETYIDIDWLEEYGQDIICLTGGPNGALNKFIVNGMNDKKQELLSFLINNFKDRLYVELQRHYTKDEVKAEDELIAIAYSKNIPLVATNEPNFISPDMHRAHDTLLAIREKSYVLEEDRYRVTKDHYMKNTQEMEGLFSDIPEAIENTLEIAQRCYFASPEREPLLPSFGKNEKSILRNKSQEGLDKRLVEIKINQDKKKEYHDRLEYELSVIEDMGFAGYFLIVADFIQWAKEQGIPVGAGRGSGAGSLVAWSLTITDLDPIKYGLIFERFLNPDRVSMPDFDIDFCQERRGEVIEYVQKKYGHDKVSQIITFGTLQSRAVVRDVGRVMQIPLWQVDKIAKMVPNNPNNPTTLKEAIASEKMLKDEIKNDSDVADFLGIAVELEGLYRNASTHAAGIIIADRPILKLSPLYIDDVSTIPATQFSMNYAESAGLVKFDFLGLKTLTVIDRCVKMLSQKGIHVDINNLDLNDPKVYLPLYDGFSLGVFQLESSGMRDILSKLRPDSLEELSTLIALYRPGPMQYIPNYIARKFGKQDVTYYHESIKDILEPTYGIMVYQEQVMKIAQVFSGYTLAQADILRKIMGKKKVDEIDAQREVFVEGAVKLGRDRYLANKLFTDIQEFARYSFNLAHSSAYGYISFQTAYLKAYYPVEFIASCMSLDIKNTEKLSMFYQEARKMGVTIQKPCVNNSEADFCVKDNKVIYGLGGIKSTGLEAMKYLCHVRGDSFASIDDFANKVDVRKVNKRALEALVKSGAMDCFGLPRKQIMESIPNIQAVSRACFDKKDNSLSMFYEETKKVELSIEEEFTREELLNLEFKSSEIFFSGHPLEAHHEKVKTHKQYNELYSLTKSGITEFIVSGVVIKKIEKKSKDNKNYAFVTLLDMSSSFEFIVGQDILEEKRQDIKAGEIIVCRIGTKIENEELKIFCNGLTKISEYKNKESSKSITEEDFYNKDLQSCIIKMSSGNIYNIDIRNSK
jgi:DNA polymerase-3 subunit alpha